MSDVWPYIYKMFHLVCLMCDLIYVYIWCFTLYVWCLTVYIYKMFHLVCLMFDRIYIRCFTLYVWCLTVYIYKMFHLVCLMFDRTYIRCFTLYVWCLTLYMYIYDVSPCMSDVWPCMDLCHLVGEKNVSQHPVPCSKWSSTCTGVGQIWFTF